MKNLFAAASYSFNNFYDSLNTQGQMIFSAIMLLIVILCILLLITYVIQCIQSKIKINKLQDENISKKEVDIIKESVIENIILEDEKKSSNYDTESTEILDIAKRVEEAINEETPIILTNFEEDQEKTAIISINELMKKAKELELIEDDESTGINYLEKYNLEPAEIMEAVNDTIKPTGNTEVKAFRVSQVISPIYGVKKEAIDDNN